MTDCMLQSEALFGDLFLNRSCCMLTYESIFKRTLHKNNDEILGFNICLYCLKYYVYKNN